MPKPRQVNDVIDGSFLMVAVHRRPGKKKAEKA
jgi:hypothetical protein